MNGQDPAPAIGARFDLVIHAPLRLQICALLRRGGQIEFGTLRTALDVSDATLSKHLKTLAEAGYVELRRVKRAHGHARTWVQLTTAGGAALARHFAFLDALRGTPHLLTDEADA